MNSKSILLSLFLASVALPAAATDLTVMSFNIWGGGANADKPVDETVAVIKAVNPDIIGIQETKPEPDPCDADNCVPTGKSVAADIAKALGYHYYDQSASNPAVWANAILSRYPIGKATKNDLCVEIAVDGRRVAACNIHLTDFPYQPYQLLNIEYGPAPFLKTAAEAVEAAKKARGPALDLLEADLKAVSGSDAAFIFGDFNEPSHLDWTEAAVKAGLQPMVVAYPSTLRIESWGFHDLFRTAWPDVAAKPALTWTPTSEPTAKDDHHDRIDFTFGRAKNLKVLSAGIVGEKKPEADIVVTPWPADHRATMAKVSF
ncbi:endonuclease/exonuclease/phosphatase family protein [Rhizobium alvei]|uniref:Endonuclease/exonuclease/phosphatase family protein n=1 Tax=Rhizobium alvei TaxID=1132659 RepID=A0ABT8YGI9_9HYPH|nr:endonuclease/exonuclease/phosphatase family protein [Rhizobium alvei]MDO6962790.1 endonuclease/exonuclease/phosphatase family protein [Rhizobium alvei]